VPGIGWVGYARDDLGNEYVDLGGAYGPAGFGERTEGTLTMPFPADEAKALRVRLWPGSDPDRLTRSDLRPTSCSSASSSEL